MIRRLAAVVAVSNTGPIVSAFQCGAVDLLREYFRVLFLPPATVAEYAGHGLTEEIDALIESGFAEVTEISPAERRQASELASELASLSKQRKEPLLHMGEAEALALMEGKRTGAHVVFVDEPPARRLARDRNLPVIGFPGVLIDLAGEGLLSADEVRERLRTCREQGTFYGLDLIEEAYRLSIGEQEE